MTEYFCSGSELPPFLPYPRFLLDSGLPLTACRLFALLLDRATLSQRSGWVDDSGRVYVIYTIKNMAEDLKCSAMSVKRALDKLERTGYIERSRSGYSSPNHIMLKLPAETQKPPAPLDDAAACDGTKVLPATEQECSLSGNKTVTYDGSKVFPVMEQDCAHTGNKTVTCEGTKVLPVMEQKCSPNQLSNNQLSNNQLREQTQRHQCGSYRNVLLSNDDMAKLQQEFPSDYQERIERLSEYMASSGRRYNNHLATLRSWARADAARQPPKPPGHMPDYSFKEGESL